MKKKMLSERYKYDGKPLLKLNTLQLETKAKIDKKVENGIYKLSEELTKKNDSLKHNDKAYVMVNSSKIQETAITILKLKILNA